MFNQSSSNRPMDIFESPSGKVFSIETTKTPEIIIHPLNSLIDFPVWVAQQIGLVTPLSPNSKFSEAGFSEFVLSIDVWKHWVQRTVNTLEYTDTSDDANALDFWDFSPKYYSLETGQFQEAPISSKEKESEGYLTKNQITYLITEYQKQFKVREKQVEEQLVEIRKEISQFQWAHEMLPTYNLYPVGGYSNTVNAVPYQTSLNSLVFVANSTAVNQIKFAFDNYFNLSKIRN